MKTLPDNPSLDHLRQQAKDLLAGLRDSDPQVTLATAQASLARQYGFQGWPELKAEVDRLHGRSELADPALAEAVATAYGLGEVREMRSVARADEMGRQWQLVTDQGRWAARTMDTWIPIVPAETDVALQEAAAAAGVLLPRPVRSRRGAVVESIGGHEWRVSQWRHSGPPLVAPVSAAVTSQVGQILATVHLLGLPVERISPWHGQRLSDQGWPELVAHAKAGAAEWADLLAAAAPELADLERIGQGAPTADPVLVHNTLGPASTRRAGGQLVVVGWEHAGGQPPAWELADALVHWCIDPGGGVNAAGARALVDGYRARAGGLPPMELAMFRGAVISLVNYVNGLAEEALAAAGDDRRYADRSVRHVLTHLPSRRQLEQLLEAAT